MKTGQGDQIIIALRLKPQTSSIAILHQRAIWSARPPDS